MHLLLFLISFCNYNPFKSFAGTRVFESIQRMYKQSFLQSTIDALSEHVAIINEAGEILLVNQNWREFARENNLGLEDEGVGWNYLTVCDNAVGEGSETGSEAARGIRSVIAGELEKYSLEYPCPILHEKKRWFRLQVTPIESADDRKLLIVHEDISMNKMKEEISRLGEAQYRTMFDVAGDAIFLMEGDRFIDCNTSTLRIFECSREQILNTSPYQFSPSHQPDGRNSKDKALELIEAALEGESQLFEWTHLKADGTPFDAEVRLNRVELYGQEYVLASVRDISGRKKGERERKLNEDRLISLLELSQIAHTLSKKEIAQQVIEEAVKFTDSQVGYVNFVDSAQESIELGAWSKKAQEECRLISEGHYPIEQAGVWADCLRLGKPVVHNNYQEQKSTKGYPENHVRLIRHASVPIFKDDKVRLILGVGNKEYDYDSGDILQLKFLGDQLQKILERKQAESELKVANEQLQSRVLEIESLQVQLRQQAIRDYLTGLFNRRYMEETLIREIARAKRESKHLSLMILDGDNFKKINDTYGHQAGDMVLKELANFLLEKYRAGDIICRYGGDEFVVVMPDANVDNARKRAIIWQKSFSAREIRYKQTLISVTFSIGIATFPVHASSSQDLLQAADQALYYSKEHKSRVTISSNRIH